MGDSVKFSVIVPVYNVKLYLRECIDSILQQTYDDFELILVDDGSTDGSGKIIEEYNNFKGKVKTVHQQNAGLSAARNTGIRIATGDYIMLVDSDDYITPSALQNFANCIVENREPDVVAAQAYTVDENGKIGKKNESKCKKLQTARGRVFWERAIKENAILACAPFNVYKRKFLQGKGLAFEEGLLHEDELWTPQVFWRAQSVVDGDFLFYYHRMRRNSITHTNNFAKRAKDLMGLCMILEKMYLSEPRKTTRWSRDHLAMLYMSAVYLGGKAFTKEVQVDRFFPIRNAKKHRNKAKAILFLLSPALYCDIDKIVKNSR